MYVIPKEARNLQFERIDDNYCGVHYRGSRVGSILKDEDEYVVHVGPAGIRFRETSKAHLKRSFVIFLAESGYITTDH